jgi:hypothetical protein
MGTLVNESRLRTFYWKCLLKSKPVYWSLVGYSWFSSDSPGKSRDIRPGEYKFSKKFRSHLKVPGARFVTRSKFHTEDPQILGTTAQNLMPGFLCVPVLDLPHSDHDLFLPNILQFTVHHWPSKVWHTDRVLKPATKVRHVKMRSDRLKAVCIRLCTLKYDFIPPPFKAIGA